MWCTNTRERRRQRGQVVSSRYRVSSSCVEQLQFVVVFVVVMFGFWFISQLDSCVDSKACLTSRGEFFRLIFLVIARVCSQQDSQYCWGKFVVDKHGTFLGTSFPTHPHQLASYLQIFWVYDATLYVFWLVKTNF